MADRPSSSRPDSPAAKDTSIAYVLIKPDGVASPAALEYIDERLASFGLDVLDRFDVHLTRDDIARLWPHLGQCVLTIAMVRLYLTSGSSRVLVVTGREAVDRCGALKKEVRGRFGRNLFANCVHCPSDGLEVQAHLNLLWPAARMHGIEAPPPSSVRIADGVWGRLALDVDGTADAIARALWERSRQLGWDRLWPPADTQGEAEVVLFGDRAHSLDFATSAVSELFPEWDALRALVACLEVHRTGSVTLARANRDEAAAMAARLCAVGLDARVVTSAHPELVEG